MSLFTPVATLGTAIQQSTSGTATGAAAPAATTTATNTTSGTSGQQFNLLNSLFGLGGQIATAVITKNNQQQVPAGYYQTQGGYIQPFNQPVASNTGLYIGIGIAAVAAIIITVVVVKSGKK